MTIETSKKWSRTRVNVLMVKVTCVKCVLFVPSIPIEPEELAHTDTQTSMSIISIVHFAILLLDTSGHNVHTHAHK